MSISRYIKEDLRAQIEPGRKLPFKLTLGDIARHYKVSMTPVRAAVQVLIAEEVLHKGSNGRLEVKPAANGEAHAADDATASPAPPPNWRQIISADIIRRSVHGETGYLREEAMARSYGVSRTVIRQVFSQLVGKGVLEHVPRAGWRIRRFDEMDMSAYLTVREALELKALDLAKDRLEAGELESMLAGNPAPHPGAPVQLDNRIHQYLIDQAGNFYIKDFFERHGVYYMMLFEQAALEAFVVAEMAEQHRDILTALLAQDWPRARAALAHHIRSQQPVMRKVLDLLAAS